MTRRTALTTAGRPKRSIASTASAALSTSSTYGSLRRSAVAAGAIIASIAEKKWVYTASPVVALPQQQIQTEAGDVVGDRIKIGILVLVQNFHVAVARLTGFRPDRAIPSFDFT